MTVFEVIGMGAKKYGGFERYIVEEARQLKIKNHKLVVIFDREPIATQYIADLRALDTDLVTIPQDSKIRFIKQFWKLLLKYRPAVVHTNFSNNLFYTFPLSMLTGVKKRIYTQHCLPTSETFRLRISYQLTSILATKIAAVSDMSTKAQRKAVWLGQSKINTLYLGVDDFSYDKTEVRNELGIKPETVALMNVAYHNPVKGVDVLIDAMNLIVNHHGIKNLILYQIGGGQTGKDTEFLHALCKDYGLDDNIVWLGIRNDVPRILSAGYIYVQPSRSEGIPLSIMEASIAGLPIIATKVGGNPEAAIDGLNARIVPAEDSHALAYAIFELYNDRSKRMQYGDMGRKIALETFRLKNNVTKLIEDYYQI